MIFAAFAVPYYKLAAWGIHRVELVDVAGFAGPSAGVSESDFAETSDFAHRVRGAFYGR